MLYRQRARILVLRYHDRPQVKSVRPHTESKSGRLRYLDSDEEPTLVDITGDERGFRLDLALKQGVIEPWAPPAPEGG